MGPELKALFGADATLHPIDERLRLWSALAPGGAEARYDDIADTYDRVIGSRLYQRLLWGNDPANDARFAREAAAAAPGPLLDVGCGSLLFTAAAHAESGRPSLLVDLSLGMLRRGAARLVECAGEVPPHLALVQADALDLPLRPGSFDTILCPGILHLFEDPAALLRGLARLLAPSGRLFLSSLVTDRGVGRAYLSLLARSDEVNSRLSSAEVTALAEEATGQRFDCETAGNMAFLRSGPAPSAPRPAADGPAADGPNAEMIGYWNERAGPGWVAGQEAIDAHLAPFGARGVEAAAPRPGERVLDVGCGCGATSLALARAVGAEGRVVGIDVSAPMLARARERAALEGLAQLSFVNADAQTHAFAGDFDLLFSRFGVMFFADFPAAFANLRRALRPGGRLLFLCWRELERNPWMQVPIEAASQVIDVPPPLAPGVPGPYALREASSLEAWLGEAGFEDVSLRSLDLDLPVRGGASLEESADFSLSMGPVAAALKADESADPEATRQAVRAALLRAFEPFLVEGRVVFGASAWCVSARNPG